MNFMGNLDIFSDVSEVLKDLFWLVITGHLFILLASL